MPDDSLKFIDSPWVQLGVPLAASAAALVAPRRAGTAAAFGLNAFQGINQYRMGSQRLAQIRQQQQNDENQDVAFDAMVDELVPTVPTEGAPEGGSVPEVDMNARTQTLEGGATPKVTSKWLSPEKAQLIKGLRMAGLRPQAAKMLEDAYGEYSKGQSEMDASEAVKIASELNLPPGARMTGIPVRGGAKLEFDPVERANPRMFEANRGNKKNVVGLDPETGQESFATEIGDAPDSQPQFRTYTQNGKLIGAFITQDGVEKRVVIGTPDSSPEETATNLRNKLAIRSTGKTTGDPNFDAQFDPKSADELLKKMQGTNIYDFMLSLTQGGQLGGVKPGTP